MSRRPSIRAICPGKPTVRPHDPKKKDGFPLCDGQAVHGLVGQEKVSWFLPILLPIDFIFRVQHADQQVHCPFEGLPQHRTQR